MEAPDALQSLQGKTVAILGYREEGPAVARLMRDHGIHVLIGLREWWDRDEWDFARRDGFEVRSPEEAAAVADVIQVW